MTIMSKIVDHLNRPSIEPQKRMVGGQYGWARHRFPIKGGISPRQAMMHDLYSSRNSTMLEMFKNMNTSLFESNPDDQTSIRHSKHSE